MDTPDPRTVTAWTPLPTLSLEEILARGDGAQVMVRLTRLWGPDGQVTYDGPAELRIQSHEGRVVLISVREPDWAEAGPEDWNQSGLVVEDYLLEVLGDADTNKPARTDPGAGR
jgi:hypothetical protein